MNLRYTFIEIGTLVIMTIIAVLECAPNKDMAFKFNATMNESPTTVKVIKPPNVVKPIKAPVQASCSCQPIIPSDCPFKPCSCPPPKPCCPPPKPCTPPTINPGNCAKPCECETKPPCQNIFGHFYGYFSWMAQFYKWVEKYGKWMAGGVNHMFC